MIRITFIVHSSIIHTQSSTENGCGVQTIQNCRFMEMVLQPYPMNSHANKNDWVAKSRFPVMASNNVDDVDDDDDDEDDF